MAKPRKTRQLGKRLVMGVALGSVPLAGGFADQTARPQTISVRADERALYEEIRATREAIAATRFLESYPHSPLTRHVLVALPAAELRRLPQKVVEALDQDLLASLPKTVRLQLGFAPERPWISRSTQENGYGGEAVDAVNDGDGDRAADSDPNPGIVGPVASVSPTATETIVREIQDAADTCSRIPDIYRLDCLRAEYERIARQLPKRGDYAEVQRIMARTARDLNRLVRGNRDVTKPRAAVQRPAAANAAPTRTDSFRAVQESRVNQTAAAAIAIIEEAETRLLRSAENSTRRQAHFQDVALALESGKVLLRS
ncbi:MAG: hypothetical protein AAFQ66_10495 [Pseudomonadota bacterium]